MKDPASIATIVEQTFTRIHLENMQGIPILNSRIQVQSIGFQEYQARIIGIIITPWLMNVILLPNDNEDWSNFTLGHKVSHTFPAKTYRFLVNEIEGIGFCQTHSMYSPMHDFSSHQQAVKVAQEFIDFLMVDNEPSEEELIDEDLLGRIMRGEETAEVDLNDFATIAPYEQTIPIKEIADSEDLSSKKFDRRALLRGSFLGRG